jgi:hypothetical protein
VSKFSHRDILKEASRTGLFETVDLPALGEPFRQQDAREGRLVRSRSTPRR